jgi:hypothetical protein
MKTELQWRKRYSALKKERNYFERKFEEYEGLCRTLSPRNAELEQAERTAKLNTDMSAIAWAIGGLLVSVGSLWADGYTFKPILVAAGAILTLWGAITLLWSNRCVWTTGRSK